MKKQSTLGSFCPRFAADLAPMCNFCVGSNVFLAKGLYLCYTYFNAILILNRNTFPPAAAAHI